MATIIPFPSLRSMPRRGGDSNDAARRCSENWGEIVLFTGVRYDRRDSGPGAPTKGGPRSAGRRARRG